MTERRERQRCCGKVVVTGLSPRLETGKRGRVVVIACTGREVGGLVLGATGSAKTSTKHSPTSLLDVKAEDNEKRKFRRS